MTPKRRTVWVASHPDGSLCNILGGGRAVVFDGDVRPKLHCQFGRWMPFDAREVAPRAKRKAACRATHCVQIDAQNVSVKCQKGQHADTTRHRGELFANGLSKDYEWHTAPKKRKGKRSIR